MAHLFYAGYVLCVLPKGHKAIIKENYVFGELWLWLETCLQAIIKTLLVCYYDVTKTGTEIPGNKHTLYIVLLCYCHSFIYLYSYTVANISAKCAIYSLQKP